LDVYIYDRFEGFDKDRERIKNSIDQMKEELLGQVNQIFNEKVKDSVEQTLSLLNEGASKIAEINQKTSSNVQNVEQQQVSLNSFSDALNSVKNSTQDKLKQSQGKIESILTEKINGITNTLSELDKQSKELSSNLGAAIASIEASKQPIQGLKNQIKELNSKIEGLESEKQGFQNQIKDLNSQNESSRQQITDKESEKVDLQNKLNEFKSKNETLQEQVTKSDAKKQDLQQKINGLEKEIKQKEKEEGGSN